MVLFMLRSINGMIEKLLNYGDNYSIVNVEEKNGKKVNTHEVE